MPESDSHVLALTGNLPVAHAGALLLRTNLELDDPDEFGHIADIAALGDGRFAVLDRLNKEITVRAPDGHVLRRLGGEGHGPGELGDPIALESVGSDLVVWDADRGRAFTVFDTAGALVSVSPARVPGDWLSFIIRSSHRLEDYPYQGPAEDLTRRLGALGDGSFVHALQVDEQLGSIEGIDLDELPYTLIRYDLHGSIMDTLAVLVAPRSVQTDVSQGRPYFDQPPLVGRPLWASGSGWWATGHGDSSWIRIRTIDGPNLVDLHLQEQRRPIAAEERQAWLDWVYQIAEQTSRDPSWIHEIGRKEYEKTVSEMFPVAESAPIVTAMYGTGRCLWVSGFSPADYVSGVSLTWTVIDVVAGTVEGTVRLDRVGARFRAVDAQSAYTTTRDSLGIFHVQRWEVPADLRCS